MMCLALTSALILADWAQTRDIVSSPIHRESNIFLRHTSDLNQVNTYFVGALLGNALVYSALPSKKSKKIWCYAVTIIQSGYVANNYTIGVRFKL